MSQYRINTLVVDFSVLPSRPETSDMENFLMKKIQLKMTDVKVLQFHNTRHCVFIEIVDKETALCYERTHNRKHGMVSNGKKFAIPVYVEDGAVCVRIHDLPTSMPASVISAHMQQYGTVHSMGWERWKHYFPGTINGVRVLRMHITRPIPSYLTIANELTLVSYDSQHKTCRFCNMAVHPKQKCREVPASETVIPTESITTDFPTISKTNTATNSTAPKTDNNQNPHHTNKNQKKKQPEGEQQQTVQDTENNMQAESDNDDSTESTMFVDPHNQKRRLTTKNDAEMKKPCQTSLPAEQSGESEIDENNRSFSTGPLRRSKRNK